MKELIKSRFQEHQEVIRATADLADQIALAASLVVECSRSGGELFVFGNGGSAADAQHIAGELTGRFLNERPAIKARALTTDTSVLTSVANDYSFERIFSRQLEIAGKGDLVLALSTSGNSPNICNALQYARENGLKSIAITGSNGGNCRELVDILINIPSDATPRIQEATELIFHIICELVEDDLVSK